MNTILNEHRDIWIKVMEELQSSFNIDKTVIDTYYKESNLVSFNDKNAVIIANNAISQQIISKGLNYIQDIFYSMTNNNINVNVLLKSEYEASQTSSSFSYNSVKLDLDEERLDYNNVLSSYTFENFVVGVSNRESYAASLGCAYSPGEMYTPLFIYGNSGLGKTHLLNAIGNFVLANDPTKKVYYTSGTDFVEKVVSSIQNKSIDKLKRDLYEIDVLLMDDIQFLAGKEKSHEVFFSLFNELINNRKQVCITSDRLPTEIKGLEERLISRFTSGLSVGLDSPEFETAVAILRLKIQNQISGSLVIDDDVISYLAHNFSKDVRSLEGCVNRLLFYSINFSSRDHIDLKLAIEVFKGQVDNSAGNEELSINLIKRVVADYYGLTKSQLVSKTRTSHIANARQIAMYLCRTLMDLSFVKIGEDFGKRDHSTVMSACKKVENNMNKDEMFRRAVKEIESQLKTS